jgi:hypothetical protein
MSLLAVLPSCHTVVEQSRFVHINGSAISTLLSHAALLEIPPLVPGPAPYHFFDGTAVTAEWIFVLDTINHCFWPEVGDSRWTIFYGNEELSGYWALAACLKRAMEEGIPIHQPATLAGLDFKALDYIFRGRGTIPLLGERLANLRQAGQILLDRFQGSFTRLLDLAQGSAFKLVQLLTSEFPSFNDVAVYNGRKVFFFKRAQLLIHDLWCIFSGDSWGRFFDLHLLTAFADYKLPQVLRHLGVISYEPELAERIQNLEHIQAGSAEEVEIRAATIWAVELIRQELSAHGQKISSARLDSWLWYLGQDDACRTLPYHRTRTIFY